MEKLEYYKLVNKALAGDKEARKEWADCQVEMSAKFAKKESQADLKKELEEAKAKAKKETAEAKEAAKIAKKEAKEADKAESVLEKIKKKIVKK